MSRKPEGGYARDGNLGGGRPMSEPNGHRRIEAGGGRRIRGGVAKRYKQLVVNAPRRNTSWEVCPFRGDPECGPNMYPVPVVDYSTAVYGRSFVSAMCYRSTL